MSTDERPRVLVLGADKCIFEACEKRGVEPVLVVGSALFDFGLQPIPEDITCLLVDDLSNVEGVLAALHRAGLADANFVGVQTGDETAVVTAGMLGRHYGCPAIDPEMAVYFRDKVLQKRRVAEAGIPTARATFIEDIYDVSGIEEFPYDKAVLKPIAGAGTYMTSVVNNIGELRARSRAYRSMRVPKRNFALEEFVSGEEWTADGVVYDGEVVFCAMATYGAPCLTVVTTNAPLRLRRFDPDSEAWAYDRAMPVVAESLKALGMTEGVFHMELFHDPETGALTFGECAARRGGALVHEEIQAKFNVHLADASLMIAMGRPPELDVKVRPEAIGCTYLLGKPGTLFACPSPAEIRERPGVEYARIESPWGMQIPDEQGSTNYRVGQALLACASVEELEQRFDEVCAWFSERVIVAPFGTPMRDQRFWQWRTWPDADFTDPLYQYPE